MIADGCICVLIMMMINWVMNEASAPCLRLFGMVCCFGYLTLSFLFPLDETKGQMESSEKKAGKPYPSLHTLRQVHRWIHVRHKHKRPCSFLFCCAFLFRISLYLLPCPVDFPQGGVAWLATLGKGPTCVLVPAVLGGIHKHGVREDKKVGLSETARPPRSSELEHKREKSMEF